MTDEEIINHCINRMKGIEKGKRNARFRTVICLAAISKSDSSESPSIKVDLFDGILDGSILEEPDPLRIKGVPMESLFIVEEWKSESGKPLLLGEVHHLPMEEKLKKGYLTHRDKALEKLLIKVLARK